VPHQRGPQAGPEPQKEHASTAVTAERLQGSIVDNTHGDAQCSGKIETNPSLGQMLRVCGDSSPAHRRRETDGGVVELPSARGFLKFGHELLWFESRTGRKFALIARRPQQFYVCAADVDNQNFSLHVPPGAFGSISGRVAP